MWCSIRTDAGLKIDTRFKRTGKKAGLIGESRSYFKLTRYGPVQPTKGNYGLNSLTVDVGSPITLFEGKKYLNTTDNSLPVTLLNMFHERVQRET